MDLDLYVSKLIEAALKQDRPLDLGILSAIAEQTDNNPYISDQKKNSFENLIRTAIAAIPQTTASAIYESLDLDALAILYNYNKEGAPEKKILKEHICSRMKSLKRPESLEEFIQSSKGYKVGFRLCYPENPSQTQKRPHFIQYIDEIASCLRNVPENIKSLALTIYKKEREERKKGLYVFYHAQNWDRTLSADIYKQLWNIFNPEDPAGEDFTFFRFTRPARAMSRRKDYLFMNQALFGNVTEQETVACTFFQYFMGNKSVNKNLFPTRDLFKEFGQDLLYQKYRSGLQELVKLHQVANHVMFDIQGRAHRYLVGNKVPGNIMLITVPADKLFYVCPVSPGGAPRRVIIHNQVTSDTKTILDELIRDPSTIDKFDKIEFAMPITTEYVLDPKNGPRVYSFNVADPEKLKAYIDARDKLFAQIKADIDVETAKQKSKKARQPLWAKL